MMIDGYRLDDYKLLMTLNDYRLLMTLDDYRLLMTLDDYRLDDYRLLTSRYRSLITIECCELLLYTKR